MRARIDVSEIEEQTKIRARYLRALENEEWGLLPGPRLHEELPARLRPGAGPGRPRVGGRVQGHLRVERRRRARGRTPPHAPLPGARRPGRTSARPRLSRGYLIAALTACVVIVLALIGILSHSSSPTSSQHRTRSATHRWHHTHPQHDASAAPAGAAQGASGSAVTVSLRPTARIWVCLVEAGGRKLIPGSILLPEESAKHSYRATRFEINLANNDVELLVDGRRQQVPAPARTDRLLHQHQRGHPARGRPPAEVRVNARRAPSRAPGSSSPAPRCSPAAARIATGPGSPNACVRPGSSSPRSRSWATGAPTCSTCCGSWRGRGSTW